MNNLKFKKIFDINQIPAGFWLLINTAVTILSFSLILLKPPSNFIRLLGFSLRTDFWPVIPLTAIVIYMLFRIPGRAGQFVTNGAVMLLFALPLAGLWATAHTQTSVISGVIQLNDARGYYTDALRLTIGESFSSFSSRRPLFPGFLSFLLAVTNYNLIVSLAILAAITAVSCHLMTLEIQRTNGTETAVFLLMMVFLYYRLHSGITMTEIFGIALGSLGFTILWRGSTVKNIWLIGLGIFSTTLALNARAGAFFILPLLVMWAGWIFREQKWYSVRAIIIALSAMVIGFALNLLLGRLIGQPGGIPFANFSYTLYSLAAGGKSWAYIYTVHPEVFLLPEPAHTKKIFQMAFDLMRTNPSLTIQGALFFWKALFTNTLYNVFSFVSKENWLLSPTVKWSLYILSILGMYVCIRDRKSSLNTLIIVCIVGIFLSVPFVPPTDSFRIRPYASSIAMISILPALGFGYLINKIKPGFLNEYTPKESPLSTTVYFNSLLILITLTAPVFIKNFSPSPSVTPQACGFSNSEKVMIFFAKGTYVNVTRNKDDLLDWPPNYHAYLLQKNSHNLEDINLINWVSSIGPTNTVMAALDILSDKDIFLTFPTRLLPDKNGYVQFCGHFEESSSLKLYSIFTANESFPLSAH